MLKAVCRARAAPVRCLARSRTIRRALLTRAFAQGPSEPKLLDETVGSHFASMVREHGDRPAVISRHQQITLTYEQLDRESNILAQGLEKDGVKKGDRVAASLGNTSHFAILTYALFKLGAILVPLNPAFTAPQVIAALNHLAASHLVIGLETNLPFKPPRSNLSLLTELVPNLNSSSRRLESEKVPSLQGLIVVDNAQGRVDIDTTRAVSAYENIYEDGRGSQGRGEREGLHPDDVVNIQFTSGTTSMPKAAMLTHRSILNNGKSIGDRMLLTPIDKICCPPPLYHCFGCILGYMASATHGSCIVFPTEAFDPEATLRAVQEYGCTALHGVPTMFLAELDLLSSGVVPTEGLDKLRTGIAAGTSIPEQLMRKLHRILNLTQLTISYGMTETSPVSVMTTTDDPLEKRLATVGRLMPNVTAKVVDSNDRSKILGIGEKGELVVSGYLVMKGYWGDKKKTDEVMVTDEDGRVWMHTGDEAEMDAEGYVKITGRLKDIIIRGGENIHPLDVENCLLGMDEVSDVSACGIPDERYGEIVVVFVIARKGSQIQEQTVRSWVKDRLGGHFVPKHVFQVDTFPKTPSGKVQRFKLQAQAIELLKTRS